MASEHRDSTAAPEPEYTPESGPESQFEPLFALRSDPTTDLLEAFGLLAQRGSGGLPWAMPFRHDPIAFLLDTMSDAANLWVAGGQLLYRNRAAAALNVGSCEERPIQAFSMGRRSFERRCMRCRVHGVDYLLELIRELPQGQTGT